MTLSQIPFLAESPAPFAGETVDAPPQLRLGSPFAARFTADDEATGFDPQSETAATLASELHEDEFDEAVENLIAHTRRRHHRQMAGGLSRQASHRALAQHFRKLEAEAGELIDRVAEIPAYALTEGEYEHEIETLTEEPEFEEFLGALKKKVVKLAKAGLNLAGKFLAGPIWGRIKALVPQLLRAVLAKAIGKLDPRLQAPARLLAARLGIKLAAPPASIVPKAAMPIAVASPAVIAPAIAAVVEPAAPTEPDAAPTPVQDVAASPDEAIQSEFDVGLAEAFLADDHELWHEGGSDAALEAGDVSELGELEDAREALASGLEALREGETSAPVIDNFVPALLPVLKVGMKLIGRPRVVGAISKIVAALISKLTGPAMAPALSRAIVDTGLRALSLEAEDSEEFEEQEDRAHAASALAATVEETFARVAGLPDHVLDNRQLLEPAVIEAFERAAASNLPALFAAHVYRGRPDLLEGGLNVAWVHRPGRGRRLYKKCSRVFDVTITPRLAAEIETEDGGTLGEYLLEQAGAPEGETVEGEVHLYEALAGTSADDIAAGESENGLYEAEQLHPLTREAAARLVGAAALGRHVRPHGSRSALPAGQRYYHLALKRRPGITVRLAGQPVVRPRSRLSLTVDGGAQALAVRLYLAEASAQKIATALRRKDSPAAVLARLRAPIARRLAAILGGGKGLRLLKPGLAPGAASQAAKAQLLKAMPPQLAEKLRGWVDQALLAFLSQRSGEYLAAADDPGQGLTVTIKFAQVPGVAALVSGGPAATVAQAITTGADPKANVTIAAGRRHG